LVTNMKCLCMSNSEGVGNGGNHRKRAREPLPKVEKPRKRKRPLTRNLVDVENEEQYELYLAKLRKKQPITGNKYIFLKRVCRRYVFYKTGFEKWKELLQ
jgi:hypothetical protein